jgi:hypothetical protein
VEDGLVSPMEPKRRERALLLVTERNGGTPEGDFKVGVF